MNRSIGFVLIAIAAASLLVSLYGLVQIWTLRQPVAAATVAGVDLFTETLDNIQYNPTTPLSVALGEVAKSLDNLSPTFSTIERNLNTTGDGLDQVVANLNELPGTTQPVQKNIADAQQVVTRYQSEVNRLQQLIQPIKSSLPVAFTVITLGLTFLVFWLGVIQVQVLLKGLELLRGAHNPQIES